MVKKSIDEEIDKIDVGTLKLKNSLCSLLKFILLFIILAVWYYLIIGIENNTDNYRLLAILIYISFIYLLFNILVFSNLQIDYRKKSKIKEIRKDTKIFIGICKLLSLINVVLIILLSHFIYIRFDILTTMIYFLPLCGFDLLFGYLANMLERVIIKHENVDMVIIILGIVFMIAGIIIYLSNRIDILGLITQL